MIILSIPEVSYMSFTIFLVIFGVISENQVTAINFVLPILTPIPVGALLRIRFNSRYPSATDNQRLWFNNG
jgi:hypothetical protein